MSLNLPQPMSAYDKSNEQQARNLMEQADRQNQKRTADIEVDGRLLVLISPNGTRYSVVVSNAGVLSTVAL